MKKFLTAVATACLVISLGSGVALAASHEVPAEMPDIVPVETWTCKFNDGKTMGDLNTVIAEWNEWLDDEAVTDYFAAVVTPNYFGEQLFDVGWLGAWADGNAMGAGTNLWVTEGGDMAAKFFEVLTCGSHSNFASLNIKPPSDDDDEGDDSFVLDFTNCSVKEGKTFDDVMAGMNAWAEYQAENGFQNSTWMMFPIYGESNNDYDFKVVEGHDDHIGFGADYELMGNGGHWRKNSEIFESLIDCDVARVYDAMTVREMQSDDDE